MKLNICSFPVKGVAFSDEEIKEHQQQITINSDRIMASHECMSSLNAEVLRYFFKKDIYAFKNDEVNEKDGKCFKISTIIEFSTSKKPLIEVEVGSKLPGYSTEIATSYFFNIKDSIADMFDSCKKQTINIVNGLEMQKFIIAKEVKEEFYCCLDSAMCCYVERFLLQDINQTRRKAFKLIGV